MKRRVQKGWKLLQLFLFIIVAVYGIGDFVTTVNCIKETGITGEANPMMNWVLSNFSITIAAIIMFLVKIIVVVFVCCAFAYLYKEKFYLTAITGSAMLSALGIATVINNFFAASGYAIIAITKPLLLAVLVITLLIIITMPQLDFFLKRKHNH